MDGNTHLPNALGVERRKYDCGLQPKRELWLLIFCKETTNINPT